MNKTTIEDASLDMLELFEAVSNEARKEKNAVPPLNKMLYYWTRKPLIVGRAVALASTLSTVDDVKALLGIYGDKRAYTHIPDRNIYKEKLGKNAEIKVLDPFAGAGNLAFSAAELGLDITCSDYNPLAHIIERASLEIPTKNRNLAQDFERVANHIIEETKRDLGHYYKPTHLAYYWMWCVTCPHCSQRVPLTNHMYLARDRKIGIRFTPTRDKNFIVSIIHSMSDAEGRSFTQKGGKAQCISCSNTISNKEVTQDITKNKDKAMIAIQVQGPKGRYYAIPTKEDEKQYQDAVNSFQNKRTELEKLVPHEDILPSHRLRNSLWNYGIERWNEFFNG